MLSIEEFLIQKDKLPVIDVRSEGEFSQGHIPGAINIPLLNNEERVIVGTAYKQQGQQQAISEGFRLVGPRLSDIVQRTLETANGKEILVHCWRGGMRSSNFAQFAGMARIKSQTLSGGYKAYRTLALQYFKKPLQIILLGGYTGSGKSNVLHELKNQGEQIIDLEALASHKGSAFGGLMMPAQPTTEQFQNDLFEEMLRLDFRRRVWIEDESIAIGRIFLPEDFWHQMTLGKIVKMEVSKDNRIQHLVEEYGNADRDEFLSIMMKITKRLGGQHFNAAKEKLLEGDMHAVMDILLTYYDKAYQEGLNRRKSSLIAEVSWNGTDPGDFAGKLIEI